jgi:hypothetical protein
MATITRPYLITSKTGEKRLVRASNQAQALRHVAQGEFNVTTPTADQVLQLLQQGLQPETASTGNDSTDTPSNTTTPQE